MEGLRTWVEINVAALQGNVRAFQKLVKASSGNCRIMAVVKSNAYGHGLVEASKIFQEIGITDFGVDSIVEAETLRYEANISGNILVLGHTLKECLESAAVNRIAVTISGMGDLENLRAFPKGKFLHPLDIHLKVDTGMHRQGFAPSEVQHALNVIREKMPAAMLKGIYTHLAAADDLALIEKINRQIEQFLNVLQIVRKNHFSPEPHVGATAGVLALPDTTDFPIVRLGIGLYGYIPAGVPLFAKEWAARNRIEPALSWKTIVVDVKTVSAQEQIGYGFTEKLERDSRVALLPVGYWHGYRRALSSKAYVLIRGQRAKVLGRISMDMMSVDVTDIPDAQPGDIATLIGKDGGEAVSAEELAELSDTIPHEILTCINPRIKRIRT